MWIVQSNLQSVIIEKRTKKIRVSLKSATRIPAMFEMCRFDSVSAEYIVIVLMW